MLVLSRKPQETIVIDDEVKVRVLSVKGRQVRLGIEAPREVAVNREEIHERIAASLKKSAGTETTNSGD